MLHLDSREIAAPNESRVIWEDDGFNELVDALNAVPFSEDLKDRLWGELLAPDRFPAGEEGIVYCAPTSALGTGDLRLPVKLGRKGVTLVRAFRRIAGRAPDEVDTGCHGSSSSDVTREMIAAGETVLFESSCEIWPPHRAGDLAKKVFLAMRGARARGGDAVANHVSRLRAHAE